MQVPPGPTLAAAVGLVAQVVEHLRYGSDPYGSRELVVQPAPMVYRWNGIRNTCAPPYTAVGGV